jgi:hypothetical protein
MSSVIKEAEKVPWILIILLSAFLSFIAMFTFRLLIPLGSQCMYSLGIISQVSFVPVYPYLLLALIYPFRKRLNLSPRTLTYLYTAGLVASFNLGFGFRDYIVQFSRHRLFDTLGLLNVWWEPPVSVIQTMLMGNAPTDWITWGPITFVFNLLLISFFFFASSIVLIFRRSWLDVERIPFPLSLVGHELIKIMQTDSDGGYAGKRPFSIGLLLGFIFVVPIFMNRTFPWFPDIYGWRSISTCSAWVLPDNSPIGASILGLSKISVDPISACLFFLIPLSTSFNIWFWTLVMYILDQIAFYMGYFTGAPSMGGWPRICCSTGVVSGPPFYWPIPSLLGGFLALTSTYIYLHRGYVLDTLKAARHFNAEVEQQGEAMSYRSMYAMLAISAILALASLMILGIDFFAASILTFTTGFITWFAMTMVFGMGALGCVDGVLWPYGYLRLVWPDPSTAPTNLDYVMSHFWARTGSNQANYVFGNGFYITAQSLKLASLTGASNRNTFLVAAVSWVISVPVLLLTSVWTANLFGTKSLLGVGNCAIPDMCQSGPIGQASRPSGMVYFTYGAAGFLCVSLLSILHARFIWFPFEPIGFIIATSFGGIEFGVWSVALVAWIAKSIVLRVGGSSLYERIALPIVGGFIVGVALASTLGVIAGSVRFYVPF